MTALADRVKESTTTTGTGSLTLSGAVAQFESFNTAFGTAAPFYYVITDANGTDWEVGTGELSNATTLVRTTVHQSSNADAKINLSAGTHTVFCSAPAVFLAGLASKSGKLSQFAATTSAELAGVVSDETGSGALVFATSPTLTTPNIGVATATSVNGTTIPSSKTLVVTTDKLSALAATTSAELAGVISDETGTGSLVFASSPSLTTPNIGTPSAGTLTNCTGLPVGGVSGLGTGVGTALAVNTGSAGAFVVNGGALGTPSSGTVTNLTGTASININGTVGATTPTTGNFTSLTASGDLTVDTNTLFVDSTNNRVGIGTTSPSAALNVSVSSNDLVRVSGGGTFPSLGANDRIATIGNISGGDSNGIQILSGSVGSAYVGFGDGDAASQGFVKYDNNANALLFGSNASERARIDSSGNVGVGTSSPSTKLDVIGSVKAQAAATQDAVLLAGRAGGTSSYGVTVTPTTLTASRTFTLPDADGTALYGGGPLGTPSSGTLTNATGLPVSTGVSGLGTGVATALAVNTGSSGAVVVNGGALGTPSSGTVTNLTGTASININGTVGATTANTGAFTTLSASGVATFSAGTAAAPAITTSGDTNNGIYFPAADNVAITTGGTQRVLVDSSGNVGIGTTSPGSKLDVRSANVAVGQTDGFVQFRTTTTQAADVGAAIQLGGLYDASNYLGFGEIAGRKENSTSGNWSGYLQFATREYGGSFAERMRITSTGNVGIRTNSPVSPLTVFQASSGTPSLGSATYYGPVFQNSFGGYGLGVNINSATGISLIQSQRFDGTATAYDIALNPLGGNVGIGTSSPTGSGSGYTTLHVNNATNGGQLHLTGGGSGAASTDGSLFTQANTELFINNQEAGPVNFYVNGSERMRIDSSGYLLVGTTAAGGNAGFSILPNYSSGAASVIIDRASTANTSTPFYFRNASNVVGTITYTDSAVAYNTTSDRRLKENIVPSDSAQNILKNIDIVQHDWKAGGHTRFGVVAQDLNEVYPEAVSVGDDGETVEQAWAVDYSKLVPLLVKSIQEQQLQIDALKAEVAALKGNA